MADTLRCPNCSLEIEVSTVLSAQLRESLRKELETEVREKDREFARRQQGLREQEQKLDAVRQALEQEVVCRVTQQRTQLFQDAETHAKESVALEMKDLQEQLIESKTRLEQAQSAELLQRKERRELEAQKQELELSVNRWLDQERTTIREEAKREAQDENRLREADQEQTDRRLAKANRRIETQVRTGVAASAGRGL